MLRSQSAKPQATTVKPQATPENRPMLQPLQRAGFRLERDLESTLFHHACLALPHRAPNFSCNTAAAL